MLSITTMLAAFFSTVSSDRCGPGVGYLLSVHKTLELILSTTNIKQNEINVAKSMI